MAASLKKHTKLTLNVSRFLLQDTYQNRTLSSCQKCFGNTWHIFDKPRRLREIAVAPAIGKTVLKDVKEIIIPDQIARSPTAILEALASTVRNDVNQPIYMTIDDPHLYATSDRSKKTHLAAMESGRKAAKMMLSMYPDYFTQIWDEPLPDSMRSPYEGYKCKEASEEALLERIAKLHVGDAIKVYKALVEQKQPPSQETQEKLLELLTVSNCKNEEVASDLSGYIDSVVLDKSAPMPACSWKKGNMAEQVFHSLPEKTAQAYSHMIRGMAANYDKAGALELFNAMKTAHMPVDVYTYNSLLTLASLDTETMEDVKQFIEMILRDMAASSVQPNVETFNSVLCNCRRLSRWLGAKNYALSVLAEMKACGIEPSLGTWKEILSIFYYYKEKTSKRPEMFEQILQELEGKEFQHSTESDVLFFRSAMRVVAVHLPDSKLALRVHKLLRTGKNTELLGHRQLQFAYYNDLFSVIIPTEQTDLVMEIYQSVAPFIYLPNSEIYKALLENIDLHDEHKYIPQLFADLQWTPILKNQDFMEPFAQSIAKHKQEKQLQTELCAIASSILSNWQEQKERNSRDISYLNGSILGDFITVYLNNCQLNKARELFQLYRSDHLLQQADPSESSLNLLAEHLIREQDYTTTKEVLELMVDLDYSGVAMLVDKAAHNFNLTDQERNYLEGLAAEVSSSSSSTSSDSEESD